MLRGMFPQDIGLFDLAARRLAWTERRQEVLAQNIANANTPGFRPHDLKPFAAALAQAASVAPTRTQPDHLPGTTGTEMLAEYPAQQGLRAPDGNAVALDTELVKVADTATAQSLVTTIYKKYLGLFSLALGRAGTS